MEAEAVFETWHVEVAALACIVGGVNADPQVGTMHEHILIEAHTHACALSKVVEEVLQRDFATWAIVVFLEQPHITSI